MENTLNKLTQILGTRPQTVYEKNEIKYYEYILGGETPIELFIQAYNLPGLKNHILTVVTEMEYGSYYTKLKIEKP